MKVKSMLKNFNNIVEMKIMYNNLSLKELNKVILKLLHLTEREHNEQKEESIVNNTIVPNSFEELKRTTSDYISFTHRKRNEPLTTDQIQFLRSQIEINVLTVKQISSKFYVSPSVLYKIKRMTSENIKRGCLRRLTKLNPSDKNIVLLAMKEYLESQISPYTAIDVKAHLKAKLDIELPVQLIRKFLKYELNYSFKRVSSKPTNLDLQKLLKLRKIFALKFLEIADEDTLIINVDESTISRTCKLCYSWSKKGKTSEFKNTIFQGSLSMILAVTSQGNWLMGAKRDTISSDSFIQFLVNLEKWVKDNDKFG